MDPALTPDQLLDQEFAFVSWDNSCRDPLLTEAADFRECRRIEGHAPGHASGFGSSRIRW